MPGFNGTGPAGLGPLTGGGRGPCAYGTRRMGLGRSRGTGRTGGRFIGAQTFRNYDSAINTLLEENEYLSEQLVGMERELVEIKSLLKGKNE